MKVLLSPSALKALLMLSEGRTCGFSVGAMEELLKGGYVALAPDEICSQPEVTGEGWIVLRSLGVSIPPSFRGISRPGADIGGGTPSHGRH